MQGMPQPLCTHDRWSLLVLLMLTTAGCREHGAQGFLDGGQGAARWPGGCDAGGCSLHARKVVAGRGHTCAVLLDGGVACWGRNDLGQLGNGSTVDAHRPVMVRGLGGVVDLSAFDQTCALLADGTFRCWGQLEDGTRATTPVVTSTLRGVLGFSNRGRHSCALVAGGSVWCWGPNEQGQLGDGTTADSAAPVQVQGLVGVTAVAVGERYSCALAAHGEYFCWGSFGGPNGSTTPVLLSGSRSGATIIASASRHHCYIGDGTVACMGENAFGQVGNGEMIPAIEGAVLVGGPRATAIGLGDGTTCDVQQVGQIACWGRGAGPNGGNSYRPVYVPGIQDAVAVAVADSHLCATFAGGAVHCWGANDRGQLGDGTTTDSRAPVPVMAP
jgi:alpha-tubulin suppressor-like RCC1 family protein